MDHKARAADPDWWSVVREGFREEVTFNTEPGGPTELARQDWGVYESRRTCKILDEKAWLVAGGRKPFVSAVLQPLILHPPRAPDLEAVFSSQGAPPVPII